MVWCGVCVCVCVGCVLCGMYVWCGVCVCNVCVCVCVCFLRYVKISHYLQEYGHLIVSLAGQWGQAEESEC